MRHLPNRDFTHTPPLLLISVFRLPHEPPPNRQGQQRGLQRAEDGFQQDEDFGEDAAGQWFGLLQRGDVKAVNYDFGNVFEAANKTIGMN